MKLAEQESVFLTEIEADNVDIKAIEEFIRKYNLMNFEHPDFIGYMISSLEYRSEEEAIIQFKKAFADGILIDYDFDALSDETKEKILKEQETIKKFIDHVLNLKSTYFTDEELSYMNTSLTKNIPYIPFVMMKDWIERKYFSYLTGKDLEDEF